MLCCFSLSIDGIACDGRRCVGWNVRVVFVFVLVSILKVIVMLAIVLFLFLFISFCLFIFLYSCIHNPNHIISSPIPPPNHLIPPH